MSQPDADGTAIVRTGRANHWRGGITDGGRLTLTADQLRFQPHRVNFDGGQALSLPLSEVEAVTAGGRIFEMLVSLRGGGQEKFVVYKRAAWLADIDKARGHTR